MNDLDYLKSLNKEIWDYTNAHEDLLGHHHWLFDLPPFRDEQFNPKYIVFGINPGEGKNIDCPTPTEETRFFDYLEEYVEKGKREKINWTKKLYEFLGTKKIIQTEYFFWSTSNEKVLREKYGQHIDNPHRNFCIKKNKQLIDIHNPESIICPGLGLLNVIPESFKLTLINSVKASNGHRLIEHYCDNNERDWVFTKHWSGARKFTNEQKNEIKSYINSL